MSSYREILEMEEQLKPVNGEFGNFEKVLENIAKLTPDHYARIVHARGLLREWLQDKKEVTVLDVGIGTTPIAHGLPNISLYVGLDFRKSILKIYRGKQIVECVTANFDCAPFKPNSFDLVLWFEGIEHSLNPDHTLKELKTICKHAMFLSTPDSEANPNWKTDWEHKQVYTPETFKQALSSHFNFIQIQKVKPYWLFAVCLKEA